MNLVKSIQLKRRALYYYKSIKRTLFKKNKAQSFIYKSTKNENLISDIFIINLERQKNRLNSMEKELSRIKTNDNVPLNRLYTRIEALDGKAKSFSADENKVLNQYSLSLQYYVDPDPKLLDIIKKKNISVKMSKEEQAVAMSHIEAWENIYNNDIPFALILEDDVLFESNFCKEIDKAWNDISFNLDFDILYLSFKEVERGAEYISTSNNLNLLKRGYWWLSGYVVSYKGAKKLLEKLPVEGPVDLWINTIFMDLRVFSTKKSIIFQRNDLKSDNIYSILPILSNIGVQDDKIHLDLERRKGDYPVFCLGYSDHDLLLFEQNLSLLSYRCYNDNRSSSQDKIKLIIEENNPLLFDVYLGNDLLIKNLEKLIRLYPNAIFILPTKKGKTTLSNDCYENTLKKIIHNNLKISMFDINKENNWNTICKILQCKQPLIEFQKRKLTIEPPVFDYANYEKIEFVNPDIKINQHDVNPWIIPHERLDEYGITFTNISYRNKINKKNIYRGNFNSANDEFWKICDHTFPTNQANFKKENIIFKENECILNFIREDHKEKVYTAAEFSSKKSYGYGSFEAILKPAKGSGIITAFFLHRNDPWQEIDIEFLGRNPQELLLNVYYNPGNPGAKFNYGNRGTPVVIGLDFDFSEDYHRYRIEWDPHELRWFVDNKLLYIRKMWEPTPIPNLPMTIHCSIWSSISNELSGKINDYELPLCSKVKGLEING